MKRALRSAATVPGAFSTHRMVGDYVQPGLLARAPEQACQVEGNGVIQKDRPAQSSGSQTGQPDDKSNSPTYNPTAAKAIITAIGLAIDQGFMSTGEAHASGSSV